MKMKSVNATDNDRVRLDNFYGATFENIEIAGNENVEVKEEYNLNIADIKHDYAVIVLDHDYIIKAELTSEELGDVNINVDDITTTTGSGNLSNKEEIKEIKLENCTDATLEASTFSDSVSQHENVNVKKEYNLNLADVEINYALKTLHHEFIIKDEPNEEKTGDESKSNILLRNLKTHLKAKYAEQSMHKCKYCYFETDSVYYLLVHVNDQHIKQNTHKCHHCDYQTVYLKNLKAHVNGKHSKHNLQLTKQNLRKCNYCDFKTVHLSSLKVHVNAKHTKQNMHKCDYCDYETAHFGYFKIHVNNKHTKQNMHTCKYCGFETADVNYLKVHVNAKHTKQNMHNCDYCVYETAYLRHLKIHVKAKHQTRYA